MRIAKLLVLSALCLFETNAWAVDADVWTKPEVTATVGFEASESTSTYFYLYNVGAKKFFTEGNAWGTQASVGSTGLKVAFVLNDYYYLFNDFSLAKNAWKQTFFDTETAMYVDHNGQANYYWGVEENGSTFRLFAHEENPGWEATTNEETGEVTEHPGFREGMYVGLDLSKNADNTALSPYLDEAEGHYIDWALVTEEVYSVYKEKVDVYNAAMSLKTVLDEAESINAQVADQVAVYNNTASTVAELNAAATAAKAAIAKRKEEMVDENYANATVDNPVVVTDKFLKNTTFEGNKYDYWLGSSFGQYGGKDNAERYNMTYDTYQDVNGGLKAGVYAIGVNAFYRAGGAQTAWDNYKAQNAQSEYAKLYGRAGQLNEKNYIDYEASIVSPCSAMIPEGTDVKGGWSTVTDTDEEGNETKYIIPNNMEAAEYAMHTMGFYANKVIVAVKSETDTLRVGVRKSQGVDTDWTIFDDFSLTYYGAGADAAKLYLDESLKNFDEVTVPEGTVYTEKYLTDYQEIYVSEKNPENFEAAVAIVDGITNAKNAIDKNIELWKTYQKTCEDSFEKYCKDEVSYNPDICLTVGDLADYVGSDVKYVGDEELPGYETTLNEHKLNNEELQAEIDFVNGLCEQIDKEAKEGLKEGDDVTRFLKNADFEMCDVNTQTGEAPYWTVKKDVGNVTAGPLGQGNYDLMVGALGKMNYCFESWHSHDFDVYQEVNNVPEGVYVIEAQGYVRCENNGYSRPDEVADADIPIHLYLNNATDVFPSVYSELAADLGHEFTQVEDWTTETQGGNLYPNSMGGAAQCFEWGMYKMQTYGLVKAGETMRIGVKGKMKTDNTENWWCIWDNFKLTFQGYNVEYVQPALDKAMASIDVSKPMGKNVYDTAKGLADKAAEAKATGDGKTMFQMLADVYDASAAIISSVQLFATLQDAIENETTGLQAAIYTSANDKAKAEAEALVGTITSGMENHDINDDEVAGLLEQIANMKTKLAMPADWESATDDNSADFTGVIVNPAYDEGVSGWSGTGAAWSDSGLNAEIFGKDYDYYQDIIGLPAGTYEVTVQGFYRAGDASTDYNTWIETPDENNNAYLYAAYINGTDTVVSSVPLKRLAAEAESEADGAYLEDGYVYAKNPSEEGAGDGWIVPNNMTTASYEFDKEKYNNKVIVKLGSDNATLRIGLKKEVNLDNNWSIWDNWHINYFGKASSKEADGDAATAISTMEAAVAPVKVEFFTIDGRKAIRAQKGVILQKTTLSNGATIIKKIMK